MNHDIMNSNELPLNRQRTDFTTKARPEPLDEKKVTNMKQIAKSEGRVISEKVQ